MLFTKYKYKINQPSIYGNKRQKKLIAYANNSLTSELEVPIKKERERKKVKPNMKRKEHITVHS